MPARISSTGMSSAQAAPTAASTFSTWKATRPPWVSGIAATSARRSWRGPCASTMAPSRTNTARPSCCRWAAMAGRAGSMPKKITAPSDSSAISTTRGSRAFSTV